MRFYLGCLCLFLTVAMPLSALFVPFLGLSGPTTAAVMTGLTVGAPEILTVLAAMLLGKETLHRFFATVLGWLKRPFIPAPVPRWRYQLGLAMIFLSALPSWILAYQPTLLDLYPRIAVCAAADLAFLAGFLVAGGELWDKLRKLVTWEGHC